MQDAQVTKSLCFKYQYKKSSHVGSFPGLKQYMYYAEDKVSCLRTQHSASVKLKPETPNS